MHPLRTEASLRNTHSGRRIARLSVSLGLLLAGCGGKDERPTVTAMEAREVFIQFNRVGDWFRIDLPHGLDLRGDKDGHDQLRGSGTFADGTLLIRALHRSHRTIGGEGSAETGAKGHRKTYGAEIVHEGPLGANAYWYVAENRPGTALSVGVAGVFGNDLLFCEATLNRKAGDAFPGDPEKERLKQLCLSLQPKKG